MSLCFCIGQCQVFQNEDEKFLVNQNTTCVAHLLYTVYYIYIYIKTSIFDSLFLDPEVLVPVVPPPIFQFLQHPSDMYELIIFSVLI